MTPRAHSPKPPANFLELATQIANHLPGWQEEIDHNDYNDNHNLIGPNGAKMWLRLDAADFSKAKRITVRGDFPTHNQHNLGPYKYEDRPHISVSVKRRPATIAKEITRRFLPKYLPLYATAMQDKQDSLDRDALTSATLLRIAQAAQTTTNQSLINGEASIRFEYSSSHTYGHFTAHKDRASLELHNIPVSLATQIARLVAIERTTKES